MADAVAVDRWSAEGVRLSAVIDGVAGLRVEPSDHHSPARTAVMTLIAVAPTDDQADEASGALRDLAGQHPSRIIVLRPDPDQVASLSAEATLYAIAAGNHRTHFEEIELTVGGQAAHHLDSVVEAFTLSDLPIAVWYVHSIPDAKDPLLSIADAVLIDSRDAPDPGELRSLLQLARRRTMVDLSWNRLAPVREMLAALFEPATTRPWLEAIDHVAVEGKSGPRRLLAGWLVAQTGVSPRHVTVSDARHAAITVTAVRDGQTATFTVERVEGQRLVAAEAVLPDGRAVRATAAVPSDPLPTSLAAALTHLRPDPVWERALSAVAAVE